MSLSTRLKRAVALLSALAVVLGCRQAPPLPTPTPDYPMLETRIAAQLGATATARAPKPSPTVPGPTATPDPTATVVPGVTPVTVPTVERGRRQLAYVRIAPNGVPNILVRDLLSGDEAVLTHFAEPMEITDLSWSRDGQWISFVSSHDLMHSRNNERNVFLTRSDGTDLHMITGEYADPTTAPGPYAVLLGQVTGASGSCRVSAQGAANAVDSGADGSFELPGVPASAIWVRAICAGDVPLQGDASLLPVEGGFAPASVPVLAEGRGWSRASLSPGGATLGGLYYRWKTGDNGKPAYVFDGALTDVEARTWITLTIPAGVTFHGLDWSPKGGEMVAALTAEKSASLWHYRPDGQAVAPVVEIPNPEQEILTVVSPVWSPDASKIAFELRHWYWWGQNRFKTEIMIVSAAGEALRTVVASEWGSHAVSPAWTDDGQALYYQLSVGAPSDGFQSHATGDLYLVTLDGGEPVAFTRDGRSFYPAVRTAP